MLDYKRLSKWLIRLERIKGVLEERYTGREQDLTYHAGFDLGYLKGKIAVIEEILEENKHES